MRSAESPQPHTSLKHMHHHQQHHKHHQHRGHHHRQSGDAATASHSPTNRPKPHQQQHQQHQLLRRRNCSSTGGGDCANTQPQQQQHQTALQTAPSLIDQLLINSVSAASQASKSQQQQRRHRQQQQQQQQQQSMTTTDECAGTAATVTDGASTSGAELAAGKALARQWDVSKQFVLGSLINCLGHRMRDLQRTEDLAQAGGGKLTVLRQLRSLIDSVRRLDLVKTLYSDKKRAKQVEAAVGIKQQQVPVELLRRWSSRENEYHLYWMALLERSVAGLAHCQDLAALGDQLTFALDLVEIRGFPA